MPAQSGSVWERLLAFGGFRDGTERRDHLHSVSGASRGDGGANADVSGGGGGDGGGERRRALWSWPTGEEGGTNETQAAVTAEKSSSTSANGGNAAVDDDDYIENGLGDDTVEVTGESRIGL